MPLYEYLREDGETITITHSIKEDALTRCPTTGLRVKRLISNNGNVIFRGDGWDIKRQQADKRKAAARKDPLYTSLPEYKEDVEKYRDKIKQSSGEKKIVTYGK